MFGFLRDLFAAVKQLFCKGIEKWVDLPMNKSNILGGENDASI